jgi:hypothetical protein
VAEIDSSQVEGGQGKSLSLLCRVIGLRRKKREGASGFFTPVAKLNAEYVLLP